MRFVSSLWSTGGVQPLSRRSTPVWEPRRVSVAVGALVVAALCAPACSRRPQRDRQECSDDGGCSNPTPYCDPHEQVCVGCYADSQCGCHEVCELGSCTVLGAATPAKRHNAHGIWDGTPGEPSYMFKRLCAADADCGTGEMCNPLTGGCLVAADYTESCSAEGTCPTGPHGEILACQESSRLCYPAPLCHSQHNCCGASGLVCDPVGGLCRRPAADCTPPEDTTSLCPFSPRRQQECEVGLFCTNLGECVGCSCDEDCSPAGDATSGLKCYLPTRRCHALDYCTRAEDCVAADETCDTKEHACSPSCSGDAQCAVDEYCLIANSQDGVCRPRSELPCTADPFDNVAELGAGNETAEEARTNEAALVLPTGEDSVAQEGLSLCEGDVDWYTLELEKGTGVHVTGTSLDGLQALMFAYAPDAFTEADRGFIGVAGADALDWVALSTDTHFVKILSYGDSQGTYKLVTTQTELPLCLDTFESAAPNNTPAAATLLNSPEGKIPEGCSLTGETGDSAHSVVCSALKLCSGDGDYYAVRAARGAELTTRVKDFAWDVLVSLYGPFAVESELDARDSLLLATSTAPALPRLVRVTARTEAFFLLYVRAGAGGETPYELTLEHSPAPSTCVEDRFDASILNDAAPEATLLPLTPQDLPGTPESIEGLRLCRADKDWFRLGVEEGQGFADLPPGLRVQAALEGTSADDAITLAAGADPGGLTYGSPLASEPASQLTVPATDGGPLYLFVGGLDSGGEQADYGLSLALLRPPACSSDDLGDAGPTSAERNDTPALATHLEPAAGWPSEVGEGHRFPTGAGEELALCVGDDDWYVIDIPSPEVFVLAHVFFDHREASLGLALYDEDVAPIDESTPGAPLPTGLLAWSADEHQPFQRVLAAPGGARAYVQVFNPGAWPALHYALEIEFLPLACFDEDPQEPNDTWETPAALGTALPEVADWTEVYLLDPLTLCSTAGGERDFFRVPLRPGDSVQARVRYNPDSAKLALFLYAPGPQGQIAPLREVGDNAETQAALALEYVVGAGAAAGDYLLEVEPLAIYASVGNFYALDVTVARACEDDDWEPSGSDSPAGPVAYADLASTPVNASLVLCQDEDWLELVIEPGDAPPAPLSVCASFTHDNGDIDIELYGSDKQSVLGASRTKEDEEVIVATLAEGAYFLRVYLDPRDQVNTTYVLGVYPNDQGCTQ